MLQNFIYDIPTKVLFGPNQLSRLAPELSVYGKKVLLVYGGSSIKKIGLYDRVMAELTQGGFDVCELSGVEPNPRISSVRAGAAICKEHGVDIVLAVGGGSVIDAAKWIAASACVEHDPWDFFVKMNQTPVEKALPIATILTLAATGSEMDAIGVISNLDSKDKYGRGAAPYLYPRVSFLDPTLTYTVGAYQTACGSADILSHVLETYFNVHEDESFYMLDCFMEGLMKSVIKYAPIALAQPDNYEARANLMWASSWAINGFIRKPQPWSCHPMEHELSAQYDITHGLGLAILTPRWMEYCLDDRTLPKYVQFGKNVFGICGDMSDMEIARQAIEATKKFLYQSLGLTDTLTKLNITDEHFGHMAAKVAHGRDGTAECLNGMKPLYQEDVEAIYRMCL
ncbi:MAG: iron-containing alcohol dehydrogenase [Pyramidobacter sp.]|nr:iron-containing alcohol dehydrogenase [Pyramidobacter sp.]